MVTLSGLKTVVVTINLPGAAPSCPGEVFSLGYRKGECLMTTQLVEQLVSLPHFVSVEDLTTDQVNALIVHATSD